MTPFLFIAIFPIYWMAITAFKQEPDLYRMDNIPFWFNLPPTLKNFETLFYQTNYGYWIINTLTISAWVALITLIYTIIVDCIEGYVLTPRIMGRAVEIKPVVSLLAMIAGSEVFGI